MNKRFLVHLAPDGAGSGSVDDDDNASVAAPPSRSSFVSLDDPYTDDLEDYVVGDEPATDEEDAKLPEDIRGKTKAQIAADFLALKQAQAANAANPQTPATPAGITPEQYAAAMEKVLGRVQQPVIQQPQETAEAFQKRMNELWLENPNKAFEELSARQLTPMLGAVTENQTALSKEMMMLDTNARALYQRYEQEVEQEVKGIPVAERFRNPRVYQTALERVKARHMDTLLTEQVQAQVQAGVTEALKAMGIAVGADGKPVQQKTQGSFNLPANRSASTSQPQQERKKIMIPTYVAQEATRKGVDPKVYYRALKEAGRI